MITVPKKQLLIKVQASFIKMIKDVSIRAVPASIKPTLGVCAVVDKKRGNSASKLFRDLEFGI